MFCLFLEVEVLNVKLVSWTGAISSRDGGRREADVGPLSDGKCNPIIYPVAPASNELKTNNSAFAHPEDFDLGFDLN